MMVLMLVLMMVLMVMVTGADGDGDQCTPSPPKTHIAVPHRGRGRFGVQMMARSSLLYPCKECDKCFEHRSQLMKHKKENHLERISKCREFLQGNCNLDENSCWFGHNIEQKENEKMETDEDINDQVFCEALEKTPPDQMKNILLMLNKLSVQVEHLEKMSKKIRKLFKK